MGLHAISGSYLTKSAFADYRTCPGYAWLKRHQPHLLPEIDDGAKQRLRDGIEIDRLARTRYTNGIVIDELDIAVAIRETVARLRCPKTTVLFQATLFAESGYLARADILIRDGDGWRLLEVKAACGVKPEHVDDVAFQVATIEAAGLSITRVAILHLDSSYRRNGACDPQLLFTETDCTEAVRSMLDSLWPEMTSAAATLADDARPASCACHRKSRTNHCDAFAYFHPDVPEHGSVYELRNLHVKKLNAVLDSGVVHLAAWPDNVDLTPAQQRHLDVHRAGQPWIDRNGLATFLAQLQFPLHFLDFEACQTPAPLFGGCRPYQQVTFQFSLHIIAPGGSMSHCEYLATDIGQTPFAMLAEALMRQIGPKGSVVSWHATFERYRNRELAEALPAMAWFFHDLNQRMVDLEDTVRKGLYVHPGFGGRSSIKAVLPVVAPDLSYETLAIGDGMTASHRWRACQLGEITGQERDETYAALREYCHLDTLAMVRIWEHLCSLCAEEQVA